MGASLIFNTALHFNAKRSLSKNKILMKMWLGNKIEKTYKSTS